METQSTVFELLPVSQTSSHTEQNQDCDRSILRALNAPRIRLARRLGKKEATKYPKEDELIRTPLKLRNSRIIRLLVFLLMETTWLCLGLAVYRRPILLPTGNISIGRLSTPSTSLFSSAFSSFGIIWQTLASISIADLVQETYSGEWHEMVKKEAKDQSRASRDIDTVSTLVSGRILQVRHAFRFRQSTLRYRLAFAISLLLIALSTLGPNAISISSVSSEGALTIGAIDANSVPTYQGGGLLNTTYQQLMSEAVQFESVVQLDGSPPVFVIKDVNGNSSSNILFGMPSLGNLGDTADITRLSYVSDALNYDFKCQWLAPTFNKSFDSFGWSFGGDMVGIIDGTDTIAYDESPQRSNGGGYFGIYSLEVFTGEGSQNGSFAWFISSFHNHTDVFLQNGVSLPYVNDVFVDLSSIPESGRAIGRINSSDIFYASATQLPSNASTTDTVLFCDPHMQLGSVEVEISSDSSTLTFKPLELGHGAGPVGNIDLEAVSRVLGRGLNGIPWDSNVITHNGNDPSALGLLASDILFLPPVINTIQYPDNTPNKSHPYNQTIYTPRPLADISNTLNSYTSIAGINVYFSGNLGNHTVTTNGIYATQRLVINWPQWLANLSIVLVIASFVIVLTIRDARRTKDLVPLTVTTMKTHLRRLHGDLEV